MSCMWRKKLCVPAGTLAPAHRRRRTLADGNARNCLTELNGNLAAVGKSRNGQSHGRRRRRGATRGLTSAACILSGQQESYGNNDRRKKKQSHGSILAWN